jgi:hypothetical protein
VVQKLSTDADGDGNESGSLIASKRLSQVLDTKYGSPRSCCSWMFATSNKPDVILAVMQHWY